MKISNPKDRYHTSVKKTDYVLDVGGGHEPHRRANVVVDKYDEDNTHRSGDIYVYNNQKFMIADGHDLPFKDHEFDYTMCSQVLEHTDDPQKFVNELARVSPRGYLETPSLLCEHLIPRASHKWLCQEVDNKMVLYDKEVINYKPNGDFGAFFLDYLPKHSIGYKILTRTHPAFLTINYEWKDEIEILVNPQDQYYYDIFTKPWEENVYIKLYGNTGMGTEAKNTIRAIASIVKSVFKSKVLKKHR